MDEVVLENAKVYQIMNNKYEKRCGIIFELW